MRLLLDTHIFIGLSKATLAHAHPKLHQAVTLAETETFFSVASIWEIAIKTRLAKLDAGLPPHKIAEFCHGLGMKVLPISAAHASAELAHEPETRDPFDRLLLAQCQVEGLLLATFDRALASHPLSLPV